MRRSIVSAAAVVGLALVLLGALGSGGRPVALAALPPVVTAPFYVALDCDLTSPGIQDNCTLAPGVTRTDVGVVFVNNSAAPYTIGAVGMRVIQSPTTPPFNGDRFTQLAGAASPSVDFNPDFNQQALPGGWSCVPSFSIFPFIGGADLTCSDANGIGNVIAANSSVTVATVHYSLSTGVLAPPQPVVFYGLFRVGGPANTNPFFCSDGQFCPAYSAIINVPATGVAVVLDCEMAVPGIQDSCTLPAGAPSADVAIVLVNTNASAIQLAAFNFDVEDPDPGRLNPPTISGPFSDRNPDLNQAQLSGTLVCPSVEADSALDRPGAAPGTVTSFLSCYDPGNGTTVGAGEQLTLATVHYLVPTTASPGPVPLALAHVALADQNALLIADCSSGCRGAAITIVSAPANAPSPTPMASPAITKVPAGVGSNVNAAVPAANLWICQIGPCGGPGEGDLEVVERVTGVLTGDQNGDSLPDGLGAYEFQVEFDNLVIQSVNPSDIVFSPGGAGAARGPANCTMSIASENLVRFGCVTSGQVQGPEGSFDLAKLDLVPAADDAKDLFPGNDNGMPTLIKDNQCELADVFGHPVQGTISGAGLLPACGDLSVTVRILEGDLNLDCKVDVADEALIAAHYGATFGSAFYQKWFDVEPRFHDLDVDIKDLQKVFGRDGSTCQAPMPPQPPVVPPFALAG
jgi:hypothetical protein